MQTPNHPAPPLAARVAVAVLAVCVMLALFLADWRFVAAGLVLFLAVLVVGAKR